MVGRVVVASGLAAAAAVPPSLLYNPALSLPCLLLLYSTLSCLVPSLLYNPDLSLLPRFFYPPFYFTRTISCSIYPKLFSQPVPALLLPYTLP